MQVLVDILKANRGKIGTLLAAIGAFLHANPQYSMGPLDDILIFVGGWLNRAPGDAKAEAPKV